MADLTSTIGITGFVGNQSISWTSTAVVADIVDAGIRNDGNSGILGQVGFDEGSFGSLSAPLFEQLSPNYIMFKNDAATMPTNMKMWLTGGVKAVSLVVAPGGFAVIMDPNSIGLCDYSATDTDITLIGALTITNTDVAPGVIGILTALTALKAV